MIDDVKDDAVSCYADPPWRPELWAEVQTAPKPYRPQEIVQHRISPRVSFHRLSCSSLPPPNRFQLDCADFVAAYSLASAAHSTPSQCGDPLVRGEAGYRVIGGMGDAARLPSGRGNNIDLKLALRIRVERNHPVVGRPARAAGGWSAHGGSWPMLNLSGSATQISLFPSESIEIQRGGRPAKTR
jgi:hypothetical protein